MELIYYWINKKKCIHEQGFCFSPEYNISMLKVEQGKYELKISRKKENNVFLSDVISNITVLVGDNGAGKTTLLKELWSLRCYPCENEDREEYQEFNKNENEKNKNLIILKKDDGQLYLYTNIYQKNIQIQGEIIKSIFYLSDYSSIASEFIRTSGEYFGFTKIYISNSYFDDLNGMSTNGKLDELAITPARLFFISSAFFEFICPDKTYNEKVNDFGRYGMVKRYDKCGEAHIFPSLDVGFPNNILRLAGGFATGMLVVWKSGTPLVPVDTTVNVCSSSYYEFDESALKGRKVSDFFNQKIIQNIINKGSVKEGLAFSFNTGNHFILLSKSRNTGHYFLVLHSSAKQYKDTYLGLYPKPHNWYSNLIKTYQEKGSDRYIHYLKDDEALRFISIARSLNEQNRDIHNWFASEIFGDIKPIQQKTYHHYGMPTDYSIAIGTYVVDERDVVPIFSREGYPIFLFRPSSNMWSIVLEGKTKYIIPHGWGQELRYDYFAKQIQKEDFKNGKLSIKNGKFVLSNSQHGYYEKKFDIDYSARFNKKQVGVRDLYKTDKFDGKNIFGDTPYIKGTIEEILDPVALFSSDTEGAVKYYVSGEEN